MTVAYDPYDPTDPRNKGIARIVMADGTEFVASGAQLAANRTPADQQTPEQKQQASNYRLGSALAATRFNQPGANAGQIAPGVTNPLPSLAVPTAAPSAARALIPTPPPAPAGGTITLNPQQQQTLGTDAPAMPVNDFLHISQVNRAQAQADATGQVQTLPGNGSNLARQFQPTPPQPLTSAAPQPPGNLLDTWTPPAPAPAVPLAGSAATALLAPPTANAPAPLPPAILKALAGPINPAGFDAALSRIKDPAQRVQVYQQMKAGLQAGQNLNVTKSRQFQLMAMQDRLGLLPGVTVGAGGIDPVGLDLAMAKETDPAVLQAGYDKLQPLVAAGDPRVAGVASTHYYRTMDVRRIMNTGPGGKPEDRIGKKYGETFPGEVEKYLYQLLGGKGTDVKDANGDVVDRRMDTPGLIDRGATDAEGAPLTDWTRGKYGTPNLAGMDEAYQKAFNTWKSREQMLTTDDFKHLWISALAQHPGALKVWSDAHPEDAKLIPITTETVPTNVPSTQPAATQPVAAQAARAAPLTHAQKLQETNARADAKARLEVERTEEDKGLALRGAEIKGRVDSIHSEIDETDRLINADQKFYDDRYALGMVDEAKFEKEHPVQYGLAIKLRDKLDQLQIKRDGLGEQAVSAGQDQASHLSTALKVHDRRQREAQDAGTAPWGQNPRAGSQTGQPLDENHARQYLQQAGGDKAKARQLATNDGWSF